VLDQTRYSISKLTDSFAIGSFVSGEHHLDYYLSKHALLNQNSNLGQTWILHENGAIEIIGYYTISMSSVPVSSLPQQFTVGFPSFDIPCLLIGKMAVDKRFQKNGFGKYMLYDILQKAKELTHTAGCHAIIVDAIDSQAFTFYNKFGFIPFVNRPLGLFLPIQTIP
jgi:GNAT superfamily N-acetyltransferase